MRSLSACVLVCACAHVPLETPVAAVEPASTLEEQPECRVVFLPFESQLLARGIKADILMVDERLGPDATGVERLRQHVLSPSIDAGYVKHWLVGVSLGGGTAIRTAAAHPELVDGVVALAPVLATPAVVKAARRAGGLHLFEHPDPDDEIGHVFRWLRDRERPDGTQLPVHLAWGVEDPLGSISELLATAVENPIVGGGGHEWTVWQALWGSFLDHGYLQRACGAPRIRRTQ